jgi:hypothetical protein
VAVSGTSLAVVLAAAISARRELQYGDANESTQPVPSDRWRAVVVLALFVSLGLLGRQPLPQRQPAAGAARIR